MLQNAIAVRQAWIYLGGGGGGMDAWQPGMFSGKHGSMPGRLGTPIHIGDDPQLITYPSRGGGGGVRWGKGSEQGEGANAEAEYRTKC